MPILTRTTASGTPQRWDFADRDDVRIGSDPAWAALTLPAEAGVRARHAVLTRAALNRLLLVVAPEHDAPHSGDDLRVNGHAVTRLRVLRQGDTLRVGRVDLHVWEVVVHRLEDDDPALGRLCPVSRRAFAIGDEVIACPGCGTLHERAAWFLIEHCAAGCGYPNRVVVLDTLEQRVRLERSLDDDSPLIERVRNGSVIQDGTYCQAGSARDQVPFQKGQNVAYCPSCSTPFHLECFLMLDACPVCQHANRALIDELFLAQTAPEHAAAPTG